MINRVLIRIKVIQTLYSFLLVEKQFTLESTPSQPTKEKRFAYSLYLDMLALLVKLSREVREGRERVSLLESTRFISRICVDETVKSLLAKSSLDFELAPAIPALAEKVKESAIYKRFCKDVKGEVSAPEENLWADIFNLIVMTDPQVSALMSRRQNFTLKGVERMKDMMNRTFRNFLASQDNVKEVETALAKSFDMARELYFRLLELPVELTDLQLQILDDNRFKFLQTEEDRNPDLKFVENQLVETLRNDEEITAFIDNKKISWRQEDPVLLRALLKAVVESDVYADYMASGTTDMHADVELWRNLMKQVILPDANFLEALEEKSVFWNDDLDIISTFVLKSMRNAEKKEGGAALVFDKFKDSEDERFGANLMRSVYKNKDTYRSLIDETLKNGKWESERVAFMDMVILITALAEIMNFPGIPLVASINEYIELAKSYSSAKSGAFVNGVLASVIARLQQEGKLLKK